MKRITAVAVLILLGLVRSAGADEVRCDIVTKFQCDAANGCASIAPRVWNLLDIEKNKLSRCDSAGCDEYDANIAHPGATWVFEVPGSGLVAKLMPDGSFMEVATLATTAYISFGTCAE